MSEKPTITTGETPVYQEGETVPVPDKGGWIDGETGQVFPVPAPVEPQPVATPEKATPIRKTPKEASEG